MEAVVAVGVSGTVTAVVRKVLKTRRGDVEVATVTLLADDGTELLEVEMWQGDGAAAVPEKGERFAANVTHQKSDGPWPCRFRHVEA